MASPSDAVLIQSPSRARAGHGHGLGKQCPRTSVSTGLLSPDKGLPGSSDGTVKEEGPGPANTSPEEQEELQALDSSNRPVGPTNTLGYSTVRTEVPTHVV